ncbi:MAG: serine hydrolase domain-containing protein [Bacteroidota bacterium]
METEIDKIIKEKYESGVFQGAVLVARNGEIIYNDGVGYCDTQQSKSITSDTRMYLASVSKPFTAMAVMILKERNKLSYDDKLIQYIPEFSNFGSEITLRHLLTHTSGIPDYWDLGIGKAGLTNEDVLKSILKHQHLDFVPGTKYSYSNSGYVVLALIVEQVAKQPFSEFISSNIFLPLKMNDSFVCTSLPPPSTNRAIGIDDSGQISDYDILTTGDGGIFSTTSDLFLWDQALYNNTLIAESTLKEAFEPMKLNDGSTSNYGFGWELPNNDAVAHTGSLNGFGSGIYRDLRSKTLLVMLSNKGESFEVKDIAQPIFEVLFSR